MPWVGLYGPGKIPRPLVERLSRELMAALKNPEVREKVELQGIEINPLSPRPSAAREGAGRGVAAPHARSQHAAGMTTHVVAGKYVAVAILWLYLIDGVRPTVWDIAGCIVDVMGMAVIMLAPRP